MNNKMIVELQRPGYSQEMKNEKNGTCWNISVSKYIPLIYEECF